MAAKWDNTQNTAIDANAYEGDERQARAGERTATRNEEGKNASAQTHGKRPNGNAINDNERNYYRNGAAIIHFNMVDGERIPDFMTMCIRGSLHKFEYNFLGWWIDTWPQLTLVGSELFILDSHFLIYCGKMGRSNLLCANAPWPVPV